MPRQLPGQHDAVVSVEDSHALRSLHDLAASQHGVVATHQLRGIGLSGSQVHRLHRHHGWERIGARVLVRLASPDTAARRVAAAVLDSGPGAYLSHDSAAAWWGHRSSPLERPVHVVTELNTTRRRSLARVHRVRSLDPRWLTDRDGVPVVRPEMTALHLFAVHRYERAERVADRMWTQRLFSGRSLRHLLEDLGRRGRNGTAGLRAYLADRGDEYVPPESGLEARTQQILRDAGIRVRRQVDLGGERHWTGRVDFVVEGLPVVVEVQSEFHHTSLTDRSSDGERVRRLAVDGFEVVEVTEESIWVEPRRAASRVTAAIRRVSGRVA